MQFFKVTALLIAALPAVAHAGDVSVKAEGARDAKGGVIFRIYAKDGYLKQPVKELYRALAADGSAQANFTDIAPGTYAVVAIHDRNGNRKMDTNFLGIPKEKGGFSNNAPAKFGPAKFEKAAFEVGSGQIRLSIKLDQ